MFFQGPCESREELFDRDLELETVLKSIMNNTWVTILGLRMSGKTSLAKVAANIMKKEGYDYIYVNLIGVKGVRDASERILSSIPHGFFDQLREIKDYLESFGIKFTNVNFEIKLKHGTSFTKILEKLFIELSKRKKLIIILDEAQEIKGGINHFLTMLYRLRTSTRGLVFIFTGSEIGLMKTLLNPSQKNPLYGRTPLKIELLPWNIQQSISYLENGFNKCQIKYTNKEIEEAISVLGTLPGWLSFYGLRRCLGITHEKALEEAIEQGINIAKNELKNILKSRELWAKKVLRMLAYGSRWAEILRETNASTKALNDYLKTLKNLYLITEENGLYRITDPIYRQAAIKIE
jgi:AAA+ ATPase superfamily predicted ATPase